MSGTDKNYSAFAHYLLSSKLDELDKLTNTLSAELQDSQKMMAEICSQMNAIPQYATPPQQGAGLRHEDISQFLVAPTPNLLMPDMSRNTMDVDLDNMIADMKRYAQNIKNNIVHVEPEHKVAQPAIGAINWDECATSLDQFGKRIANIKYLKNNGGKRNMELEAKMEELCTDINMFNQMVQAKTAVGESNQNWVLTDQNNGVLIYEDLINKILLSTNELSYLLKNKK